MSSGREKDYARGSVGVVGCGWLGFTLSQNLLAAGYTVYGTTTTATKLPELSGAGIRAEVLRLSPKPGLYALAEDQTGIDALGTDALGTKTVDSDTATVWQADQLVLNVPPGRTAEARAAYPGQILAAVLAYRRARPAGRIVFCSSTSVYGDLRGEVDERTPLTSRSPRAVCMALAESQVHAQSQRPHVVLRLGGLYGGERHPGKYLAGRTDLPDGDAPTNLVSRERVIERIKHHLDLPFWAEASRIENVVDGEHPTKRELYGGYARAHGLVEPSFLDGGAEGKVVGTVWR